MGRICATKGGKNLIGIAQVDLPDLHGLAINPLGFREVVVDVAPDPLFLQVRPNCPGRLGFSRASQCSV